MKAIKKIATRKSNPSDVMERTWGQYAEAVKNDGGAKTTASVKQVIENLKQEKIKDGLSENEAEQKVKKQFAGLTRKAVAQSGKAGNREDMDTKTMDIGEVDSATPLVFDPEMVSILKQNAPILDQIPEEGQEGFSAKFNIVDSRENAYGYISESDAVDLTNNSPNDIQFATDEEDMELYVDKVEISDFTQQAASHYMNVEETTLGERIGLHAQNKARQIFYGDPSQDTGTGGVGDAEGFKGLTKWAEDASNVTSKSGVTSNFIRDIKDVLSSMQQDEAVNINNLVMATSYEFFDVLQNEVGIGDNNVLLSSRPQDLDASVDVGAQSIRIMGVPVIPTHNVDSISDGSYNPGDPGDVFIFSTRTTRFRTLMPMSMIPLDKTGLAETVALAEFGALIEKSQGNFVRHLQAYDF